MRNSFIKVIVFILLVATGSGITLLSLFGDKAVMAVLPIAMLATFYTIDHKIEWIRRCPPGLAIPNGIVMREDTRDHLWELMLLLPVFIVWRSRHYRLDNDDFQRGWFIFKVFARIGKAWGPVLDLRLSCGLSPTRWAKVERDIFSAAKIESAKFIQDD